MKREVSSASHLEMEFPSQQFRISRDGAPAPVGTLVVTLRHKECEN